MTEPANDVLSSLADLLGHVTQILRAGDTAAVRTDAAAQVDQLRELLSRVAAASPTGSVAMLDLARLGDALRAVAQTLRAPGVEGDAGAALAGDAAIAANSSAAGPNPTASNAAAARALVDLQAATGPLAARAPERDKAAEREQYRRKARAAMDDYFRERAHKPFKP